MENNEVNAIPYIAFESSQARLERINKRLWIALLVLIVALVGSNAGWLWWENQWQYVESSTQTVTQDLDASDGGDAIINDGVHINGESETNSN